MFEKASRLKLRFAYRGPCTVEDLWDITLKALDEMFKGLNRQKKLSEESLLDEATEEDDELTLKIDIVKHIVASRLQERTKAKDEKDRADRKQKLLGILAEKQDDDLRSMSVEDLTKLVNEM